MCRAGLVAGEQFALSKAQRDVASLASNMLEVASPYAYAGDTHWMHNYSYTCRDGKLQHQPVNLAAVHVRVMQWSAVL